MRFIAKHVPIAVILLVALSPTLAAFGAEGLSFQPPITFTRVFTQKAGELGISLTQEHYVNLVPNWLMIPEATVCFLDRAKSDLLHGRFHVTIKATAGTSGSTPVGTVVGISAGRTYRQRGLWVIVADVTWTPGIFPDVMPTSLTMTHQLVPGLWRTDQPGWVVAGHMMFASIQPPDGSPPVV